MINIYAEFQAQATWKNGIVNELRRQLDDSRQEAAELRLQVALGGAPAPGRSFVDVVTGRRDDVAVFSASAGPPGLRGTPQSLGFPGISRERQELPVPPQLVAFITLEVRQGDPLSPIIFNLVIDEFLAKHCKKKITFVSATDSYDLNVSGMAFADDLVLFASTQAGLQYKLLSLQVFLRRRGLALNPSKCLSLAMILARREKLLKIDPTAKFYVNNEAIPVAAAGSLVNLSDAEHVVIAQQAPFFPQ
ncbi:hypothetical protein HPB51_002669 [Rhipicephalus microplus]|uniref:Reverse transcriptase domain-containing protein n=1 Tax=Rhipicephalus microplus TaxID=6941 RepID=A0A9J6ER11_RHIMP|nr:hypothetical protein HPB51_002669 [Rhipicephalus microplus]